MPEAQALNSLVQTVQDSVVLQMLVVTMAVIYLLINQGRVRSRQEERDSAVQTRQQDFLAKVFTAQERALDTKEQLEKLHELRQDELGLLQNHSRILAEIPVLVRDVNEVVQQFHKTQIGIQETSIATAQHMVDFMAEQKARFDRVDEKVDSVMDTNMRLVVLLEQLNENLKMFNFNIEAFNTNIETFNREITEIKAMVTKTITSEQPAVKPEADKPKDTAE
jgi:hypothetical protein